MKTTVLFILFSVCLYAQNLSKVRIIDENKNSPIPNVRVMFSTEIAYSNDDGFVLIPENATEIEVSKYGYETQKIKKVPSVIKLKSTYKEIEEIKIISIDVKKIFIEAYKNYRKSYYTEPSVYDIIYKQKEYINDSLSFIVIADAQLWTADNSYNFKSMNNENYDEFVQIELNNLKYLKSKIDSNNICQRYAMNKSNELVGNIFFNYELKRTLNFFNFDNVKYSGKVINENGDEQAISFKITTSIIDISGKIIYNKKDKAILFYEINYDQSKSLSKNLMINETTSIDYKRGNGTILYEFYKNDKKYIPSLVKIQGNDFLCTYENYKSNNKFNREIVFLQHQKEKKSELVNKIDLNKSIWENTPTGQDSENTMLLSMEEEQFLNDIKNED